MSEVIPEGWSLEPLASCIAESIAGEWGSDENGDSNDIPVLRSTNFTNSGIIDYTKIVYRNIEARKRAKKKLNKGDIVLEKSGGSPTQPVGRVVYFDRDTPFLYSNFTQKLVIQQGHDQKYVFYKFLAEYENGTVLKFQQQTTGIINFQLSEYLLYQTLLAPLPEQQKIAAILTSVDDVIEKTRAQIDKLKNLKTAMMQELLTQGVGHTEFKDSPLGRIPASWTVRLLDAVARRGSGHTPSKSQEDYWNGNILWVSLSDSNKLDQLYITDTSKKISQLGVENSSAVLHPSGTVIMSRDAGIGKSAILARDMAVSQHFMAWICSPQLNNYFLYYLLQNWKQKFEAIAMGSTIKTIGLPFFKTLEVPMPSIQEQQKIANALKSLDLWIFSLEDKKETLDSTKKALMQDLLTGKVRVKLDPTEVAAA